MLLPETSRNDTVIRHRAVYSRIGLYRGCVATMLVVVERFKQRLALVGELRTDYI